MHVHIHVHTRKRESTHYTKTVIKFTNTHRFTHTQRSIQTGSKTPTACLRYQGWNDLWKECFDKEVQKDWRGWNSLMCIAVTISDAIFIRWLLLTGTSSPCQHVIVVVVFVVPSYRQQRLTQGWVTFCQCNGFRHNYTQICLFMFVLRYFVCMDIFDENMTN